MQDKDKKHQNHYAIFVVFILLVFLVLFFFPFKIIGLKQLPNTEKEYIISGQVGDIISSDGYTLVSSQKTYRAEIDLRSLNKEKKAYFLKLFGIYANIDKKDLENISKRLDKELKDLKNPRFILSASITSKDATYLLELRKKLIVQNFFTNFTNASGKTEIRGLDIIENKEDRIYLKDDLLTPAVGYSNLISDDDVFKYKPRKGLEKYYENCLHETKNTKIIGYKDIGNNVILDKFSFKSSKQDGCNLYLSINLKLQKAIEIMLDEQKKALGADEIVASVMDSKSGELVAFASSKRFDPKNIKDISALNVSAIEYEYEVGSVMKPIAFAAALQYNKLNPYEIIDVNNGRYKLANFIITDTHPKDKLVAQDIIYYSSNIGMIKIASRLSSKELVDFYQSFGIGRKTGIDLPYEKKGYIKPYHKINDVEKATMAYGYGFRATFMQMLNAYNVFNNLGIYKQAHLGTFYEFNGNKKPLFEDKNTRILNLDVAKQMKRILIQTASNKSVSKFFPQGLEIGGKTGTARIVGQKGYEKNYNSSYFGFANDKQNRYTIGVLVINPNKDKNGYYAAQTALPVFGKVVEIMVDEDFLRPAK